MAGLRQTELAVTGQLVTPEGIRRGAILVAAGRIEAITDEAKIPTGVRRLDAGGGYVLPGLIDSHVHFRTPGLEHKEDWRHASRAAVAGGVTTVIDMPNTVPPALDPDAVLAKADAVAGSSLVDYRFHRGRSGTTRAAGRPGSVDCQLRQGVHGRSPHRADRGAGSVPTGEDLRRGRFR
jgi:dihydroorotase